MSSWTPWATFDGRFLRSCRGTAVYGPLDAREDDREEALELREREFERDVRLEFTEVLSSEAAS